MRGFTLNKSLTSAFWCALTLYLALASAGCGARHNTPLKGHNMGISFHVVRDKASPSPAGRQATFVFRNNTHSPVRLPGYFDDPPTNGVFEPNFVEYEVIVDNSWHGLDVWYDGVPQEYFVNPGEDLTLLISLGPFEKAGIRTDVPVRVRVGEFASDAFELRTTE